MFSRIIPNWEQIENFKQPLTEGERNLLIYLDRVLPTDKQFNGSGNLEDYKGWLIFVQPYLNGNRPDIVVFHPLVGLQIIEVKDWDLNHYKWIENPNFHYGENNITSFELHVQDSEGHYPIKSPINQVEFYKEIILGQLVPDIGDHMDKESKNFGLIKASIYFQNAKTNVAVAFFENKSNKKLFPYSIIGYDSLIDDNLKNIIPDSKYTYSKFWKKNWNQELLFWLKPPFHSIEQGIPIKLSNNQKKMAEPITGHHRVRGVAGSGKTHVLAYRAAKLASMGYNVLILSFNITLWHYIRDMVQRAPFSFSWSQFKFGHFHGFCKEILNKNGVKWPKGSGEYFFQANIPFEVLNAIKNKYFDKYDAILIDEGQDYYIEWYNMLCRFLNSRDEFVVVCDKKQNVYQRDMLWLDKRKTGTEKFGNWIELKTVYRLPPKIAEICELFSVEFKLNQEVKYDKIEQPQLFEIEHYVWQNISNEIWLGKIKSAYKKLKSEQCHPSDIVILLPDRFHGTECVNDFEKMNISVNHVFEDPEEESFHRHKKAFWMGDSRLKMSTIHSFKGWELKNVVIYIPEKVKWEDKVLDSMIYTAITRTRQNLIVFNANKRYWEFGKKLPHSWDEFNIKEQVKNT